MFTLNNPTDEELTHLHSGLPTTPEFRYVTFQVEEAPETGTMHVQGYVEFQQSLRFNRVKSLISPRAWLDRRRGTQQEAIEYCQKEDSRVGEDFFEYGTPAAESQGERRDLSALKALIDSGASDLDLWNSHFSDMVRYFRGIAQYRILATPARDFKTTVYVLWGKPGTGKSRWCLETLPRAYWKQRGPWWDAYDRHENIVLDDFYGWLPFDDLLRVCDRYPLLVQTKGGNQNFVARTVAISSNTFPSRWYRNVSNFDAFIRRVTKWMFFGEDGEVREYDDFTTFSQMHWTSATESTFRAPLEEAQADPWDLL